MRIPLSLSLSKHTRIACLPLLLAACSGGGSETPAAAGAERVSCAIAGAQAFAETCTLERTQVEGAPVLVIRHADGGFRRFVVTDGSVTAIDGAQPAAVTRTATALDVTVGSDRYRLDVSQLGHAQ